MITPSCPAGGEGANTVAVQVTKRSRLAVLYAAIAAAAACYANALRGRAGGAYNNAKSSDRRQGVEESREALSMQGQKMR